MTEYNGTYVLNYETSNGGAGFSVYTYDVNGDSLS